MLYVHLGVLFKRVIPGSRLLILILTTTSGSSSIIINNCHILKQSMCQQFSSCLMQLWKQQKQPLKMLLFTA